MCVPIARSVQLARAGDAPADSEPLTIHNAVCACSERRLAPAQPKAAKAQRHAIKGSCPSLSQLDDEGYDPRSNLPLPAIHQVQMGHRRNRKRTPPAVSSGTPGTSAGQQRSSETGTQLFTERDGPTSSDREVGKVGSAPPLTTSPTSSSDTQLAGSAGVQKQRSSDGLIALDALPTRRRARKARDARALSTLPESFSCTQHMGAPEAQERRSSKPVAALAVERDGPASTEPIACTPGVGLQLGVMTSGIVNVHVWVSQDVSTSVPPTRRLPVRYPRRQPNDAGNPRKGCPPPPGPNAPIAARRAHLKGYYNDFPELSDEEWASLRLKFTRRGCHFVLPNGLPPPSETTTACADRAKPRRADRAKPRL
jgi:hypothetical protein